MVSSMDFLYVSKVPDLELSLVTQKCQGVQMRKRKKEREKKKQTLISLDRVPGNGQSSKKENLDNNCSDLGRL